MPRTIHAQYDLFMPVPIHARISPIHARPIRARYDLFMPVPVLFMPNMTFSCPYLFMPE